MDVLLHATRKRHRALPSDLAGLTDAASSECGSMWENDPSPQQLQNIVSMRNRVRGRLTQQRRSSLLKMLSGGGELNTLKSYVVSVPEMTTTAGQKKPRSPWIIRVTHSFRIKWDLFVMVLAVWNVYCIPYTLVFDQQFGEKLQVMAINLAIDFFFFVDIILTFRTTFHNSSTGDEIKDVRLIAKNYVVGRFWIDALTCVPNDLFDLILDKGSGELSTRNVVSLFGILKLYRIARLNRIINFMRAKGDVKLATRILQLILFLVMYLHLLCCAWWIVSRYDETWIPSSGDDHVYEGETSYIYWTSFYAAVQMLVGGEICPKTTFQAAFSSLMIFCGAFINAVMFGSMAVLMSNLNIKQTKFQETQNAVNTAMKNMRLPEDLQLRISDYLVYTQATMASSEEFELFRSLISPSLYNEVLQCLYGRVIRNNEVVVSNEAAKNFILPRLKPQFAKPEETLVQQNEEGHKLYFVARGTCQVSVSDEHREDKVVSALKPGSHFGEVALLTIGLRTATVHSLNYCTLATLDREDFMQVIYQWPECKSLLKHRMFQYQDRYKRFLRRMIRRVPMFKDLQTRTEQELLYSMKIERVEEGEYVVKPGMTTDRIWFIAEGEVEVSITINDSHLNNRRKALYKVKSMANFNRRSEWNLQTAIVESSLKRYTEIFPTWGPLGIESALHATELSSQSSKTLLGKKCVELRLDQLRTGSVLGSLSALSKDVFSIQAKALSKCTCFTLTRESVSRVRKFCSDLHDSLSHFELWNKLYTPYIDDYQAADDCDHTFSIEFAKHRGRFRFRGAVLRVIKDNRDRRVLRTPIIAVMLKDLQNLPLSRKVTALRRRAEHSGLATDVIKQSFNPKNWSKLVKPKNKVYAEVTKLNNQFHEQKEMIEDLRLHIAALTESLRHVKRGEEDVDDVGPYQTSLFIPKRV